MPHGRDEELHASMVVTASQIKFELSCSAVRRLLPHGDGFRFVHGVCRPVIDATDDENPFRMLVGYYKMPHKGNGDQEYLEDHFPGNPVFPGVLVLEHALQVGHLCGLLNPELEGYSANARLAGIKDLSVKREVYPGNIIITVVRLERIRLDTVRYDFQSFVDTYPGGEMIAEGKFFGRMEGKSNVDS